VRDRSEKTRKLTQGSSTRLDAALTSVVVRRLLVEDNQHGSTPF